MVIEQTACSVRSYRILRLYENSVLGGCKIHLGKFYWWSFKSNISNYLCNQKNQNGSEYSRLGGGHHLLCRHPRHRTMGGPPDQRGDKQRKCDACWEEYWDICWSIYYDRYLLMGFTFFATKYVSAINEIKQI